jgi:predicted nucleic-acid-binding protein
MVQIFINCSYKTETETYRAITYILLNKRNFTVVTKTTQNILEMYHDVKSNYLQLSYRHFHIVI